MFKSILLVTSFMVAEPPAEPVPPSRSYLENRTAFDYLPSLQRVSPDKGSSGVRSMPRTLIAGENGEFTFDSSAYFPQPRFGLNGDLIETDPAIVYEGMRVVYERNGRYYVHFLITVPNVPVRLRLQLTATAHWKKTPEALAATEPICLTLPPISTRPEKTDARMPAARTFEINHEGYSEQIRKLYKDRDTNAVELHFSRDGTARFGGGIPESHHR